MLRRCHAAIADHNLGAPRQDRLDQGHDVCPAVLVVGVGVDDDVRPGRSAASKPEAKAAANPRLCPWHTMCCTPNCRATATVPSVLPSSTISHSISSMPGRLAGKSRTVSGSVASSLQHGIWMISFTPAILAHYGSVSKVSHASDIG